MRLAASKIKVVVATIVLGGTIGVEQLHAQIVPNPGDTGTIVTPVGNRFDIGGGSLSGDSANLFHSLSQFGLTQTQIANFLSNSSTRNILVRVTGGDASRVDGLIQVSGSNANLFLINPAGIVFGANATLDVKGSFTATTANGIGFGTNWFNASGTNNYDALSGNPNSYAFTVVQPGSIINAGNLAVGSGQQLTLLGGTVVSSGGLSAPQGTIVVAAVPGQSVVRLSQPGALLSLEVQRPTPTDRVEAWTLPVLSLPQLLTGGSGNNATGLTVGANGQVTLTGSGVQISPGDVAVRQATAAPGGTLFRATGTVLGAAAFPQTQPLPPPPSPAVRLVTPPPNQALPIPTVATPTVQSPPPDVALPSTVSRPSPTPTFSRPSPPPDQFLPNTSVRQAAPPDAVLPSLSPSLVVPDCGVACPTKPPSGLPSSTPTSGLPSSTQAPQTPGNSTGTSTSTTSGNTSSSNSSVVVNFSTTSSQTNTTVALPEALPQYASQATTNQASSVPSRAASPSSASLNAVQPTNALLPTGDPEQNLSSGAIDDLNQASAMARRLEALKKYLQKRWKATPERAVKLQYTLLLDAKGTIQQIVPLGAEAATYLANLSLLPSNKVVIKQTIQGLEVMVTLNPDGTVEVIPNSLTLRN
ncbi:filamentous hemagglutinin N-terminal domain-containing protein [Stenomitos frigidus]|uniref:Filamentous haemagglutinin FhaB/tRNA nuclease CdiA-like TPS domain-containing protein n=1 Tax=Stenomitos frigidus ULC18 TaxID=2107698 RepID=A0A2T1EA41_9CYAN|nr:filamentous hemagglutinin N-terminal domain-containing protein [Stenomitos frigidus]PSB29573.1 hypothetical protein C7B82_11175 [Stenomitos frigidus ULC18]